MQVANWDDFNKKNKDKTKAFEDLCRLLFLREKKKSSYEYDYDMNEAGLEFKPVKCSDGKWYGIQCKYFSGDLSSSSKYSQIYKSVSDAIDKFKGQLDVIYIYTNGEFRHSCTKEELNSNTTAKRVELVRLSQRNKIKLEWITSDKVLDSVKQKEHRDLYGLYFSNERDLEFLSNLITPKEKTFLESDEFLDLKFEDSSDLLKIKKELNENKFSLILGDAGTGKSLALKKICNYILKDYIELYFKKTGTFASNTLFPVLIKLRECTNGNIEEIIRNRLRDYNISKGNEERQICYLFDGLDEIPTEDVTNVINHIKRFSEDAETKAIIVSSRCESTNLVYLNQIAKWNEYKIADLTKEQKNKFFKNKESAIEVETLKSIKESKLLDDISDIFSLNLLYENIDDIDINGSKIELIEISMNSLFGRYQKLANINILYPKIENVLKLCTEISYMMQQKNQLYIELKDVEDLIRTVLSIDNIETINSIVEMLLETCFEKSFSFNMTFKHRRIQEYFLYRKIESEYYDNPNILRELNLLANKDFMCNIFLHTSLKRALKSKNLFKLSTLRLLESYLGRGYISDFTNDIIIGDKYNYAEVNYKYSERLLELLATYTEAELEMFFKDDRLGILDIFNLGTLHEDTFIKLVNVYWKTNKVNIIGLLKKYNLIPEKYRIDENLLFFKLNVINMDTKEVYQDIKGDKKKFTHFLKVAINKDLLFIENIINDLDAVEFEYLCREILKFENLNLLYYREKHTKLFNLIENRIIEFGTTLNINAKVLFSFITSDKRFYDDLENEFKKYNQNHFWTWTDNLEISIYMSIILKKTDNLYHSEFKFGAKLIEILYDNKSDHLATFKKFKELLIDSNFTCKESLNFVNTKLLGIILANINFDLNQLKRFLRVAFNYGSVINTNELMFKIYVLNKEKFSNLTNRAMLSELEKNIGDSETTYYEEIIESLFSLGAMYSNFSLEKRHELLVKGIDTSICRPEYKGEHFVSKDLIECVYRGYESFWFDKQKLEAILLDIYSNLKSISNRTQNDSNMEHLKWVLIECDISNESFDEIYSIQPMSFDYIDFRELKKEEIDLENNLDKYYKFEMGQAPYNLIEFWEYIIEYGYKHNRLGVLIESLNKDLYTIKQEYIYIPILILLKYEEFRDEVSLIMANNLGRYGISNIIKIITLNDNFDDRMKYLNHMIKFMKFLTKNDIKKEHDSEWFEYRKEDWKLNESDNELYFKKDRNIRIVWNDHDQEEEFHEEWATKHIDSRAYKYDYILYINNIKIKEFSLVWIDGFRAVLPLPKRYGENIVERDKYLICKLLNTNIEELNRYMRSSGLIVE
ncbi:hypothetical protein QJR26_08440 [Clostridium baratii]